MVDRRVNKWYWCAVWEDSETGLLTEAGHEFTFSAILQWLQKNLESLPKGEGKIIRKKA